MICGKTDVNEAQGTIVDLDGDYALVRVDEGGCGRCHEAGGCGGQRLEKMFCKTTPIYRVRNPGGARIGERVTVAIEAGVVSRSAIQVYGFPLLALFAGAFGGLAVAGEPGAIAGFGLGLLAGWLVLRLRRPANASDMASQPYIKS